MQAKYVWRFQLSVSPMRRILLEILNELFTELFFSGSAAVGAALSNVPLLRSGLWLEPQRYFRSPEQPERIPE